MFAHFPAYSLLLPGVSAAGPRRLRLSSLSTVRPLGIPSIWPVPASHFSEHGPHSQPAR